uniref:RHS repeat domain-containing protein n=2 Tax=uncultured Psychroserpens sp. TaxID=255436 RepID=UPI0026306E6C
SASSSYHRDQIDYGIYTAGVGNNYRVYVFEQNVNITIPATYYVAGDVFRVLRSGDQIYYYKNDVIFYSSATTTTAELMGYGSFLHENAEAEDVFIGYSSLNQPFAQDVTGLATGSKVRTLDTDKWTTSETYYDEKGRPIQSTSTNNYLDATDRMSSKLDFVGKVIKTHATHQTGSQTPVVTIDQFTYDHADRLSRQEQRVNNEETELIARNHYDEFGQLEMKQVGGELKIDLNYANTVGVSVVSNIITKTASGSWGTAGLSTQNGILEDGYVSFTTVDINKAFMAGLSYTDPNVGYPSIKYAINITSGGDVGIYESGVNKGFKTTHVPGDTFTVERRGATIYYYKNGEHFYTSETAPTTATMYGDVAIASSNARIKDLSIYNLNTELQEVDYTYNVRGWLKDINNVDNLYATGNDLFALKLNYNKKDNTNSTSLYNGNISEIFWNTRTYDAATSESQIKRGYAFEYDALNRLVDANFEKASGANQTVLYDLSGVTYDKNGNIQTLERTGVDNLGVYQTDMDDLTYSYDGNQLTNVVEAGDKSFGFKEVSTQNDDYTYDVNGNMITDKNKDITSIEYNHLNLPTIVKFGTANTNKITYIYDATGLKLKKIVTDKSNTTTTQYRGNYIYENDGLKFFSHPEGYVEPVGKSFGYVYQYKDHLGNIRLSYSDTDGSNSINPNLEIVEENNYYPFGLKHKGYNNTVSANSNSQASKYKYNGKELNEELGLDWHDYGARNYDASLGRWMNIDPLAEKYYEYSGYNYTLNNPIMFNDPDGMRVEWGDNLNPDEKEEIGYFVYQLRKNSSVFNKIFETLHKSKNVYTVGSGWKLSAGFDPDKGTLDVNIDEETLETTETYNESSNKGGSINLPLRIFDNAADSKYKKSQAIQNSLVEEFVHAAQWENTFPNSGKTTLDFFLEFAGPYYSANNEFEAKAVTGIIHQQAGLPNRKLGNLIAGEYGRKVYSRGRIFNQSEYFNAASNWLSHSDTNPGYKKNAQGIQTFVNRSHLPSILMNIIKDK